VEVGLAGSRRLCGGAAGGGLQEQFDTGIVANRRAARSDQHKDLVDFCGCPVLERSLQQHSQEMSCSRRSGGGMLHDVDQRLARWLLMSQDRVGGVWLHSTQEFLAHMLGTRRASVTVAAGSLQKAGLIGYSRGSVTSKIAPVGSGNLRMLCVHHQAVWHVANRSNGVK